MSDKVKRALGVGAACDDPGCELCTATEAAEEKAEAREEKRNAKAEEKAS